MGPDVEQLNDEKPAVAQSRAEGANSMDGLGGISEEARKAREERQRVCAECRATGRIGNGAMCGQCWD